MCYIIAILGYLFVNRVIDTVQMSGYMLSVGKSLHGSKPQPIYFVFCSRVSIESDPVNVVSPFRNPYGS